MIVCIISQHNYNGKTGTRFFKWSGNYNISALNDNYIVAVFKIKLKAL